MKIDPTRIPPEGLEVSELCEPKSLGLETQEVKYISSLSLRCRFTKSNNDVFCPGSYEAKVKLVCNRCGGQFCCNLHGDFKFDYPGMGNETTLDVTDDIRQEVLLGYPLKALCRPDCKGLCPVCGQNLNERDCGHKAQSIHVGLSKLKDWMKSDERKRGGNGSSEEKTF